MARLRAAALPLGLLLTATVAAGKSSGTFAKVPPLTEKLSSSEMATCYSDLKGHLDHYYEGKAHDLPLVHPGEFHASPEKFSNVLTRSFCHHVVGALGMFKERKVTQSSSQDDIRRAMLGEESSSGGQGPVHRQLGFITFKGDVDPNNQEFTQAALGNGYDLFTVGATAQCQRFSPDACDNSAVGQLYFGWVFAAGALEVADASPVGHSIALGIAIAAFGPVDGVRDAVDYTGKVLSTVKNRQLFYNMRNVINNQELIAQKTAAIFNAVIAVRNQTRGIDADIKTAGARILPALTAIQAQLTALGAAILVKINDVLNAVTARVNTVFNTIVAKIRNVEARVIANVINAILDKFSIDGVLRLGRLPVPNAARRRLFEAYHEALAAAKAATEGANALTDELGMTSEGPVEVEGPEGPIVRRKAQAPAPPNLPYPPSKYLYGYGCDSNDNDNDGYVDNCEEDQFGPIINTDTWLEATQGVWFNDVPRIFTLFHGLVTGDDDCGLVTFNPPTIKGSCKNGEVSVVAADRCGINQATATVPVWFDTVKPSVNFELTPNPNLLERALPLVLKANLRFVDVGLTALSITDNCDPNPYVQINVYSDEMPLAKDKQKQAVVIRRLAPDGSVIGWRVLVMPTVAYNCKDTSCDAPDGRVFTIAVCAKDQSGLQSCTQKTIGVGFGKDKPAPVSQGAVFKHAHDAAFLRLANSTNDFVASWSPNTFSVSS